MSTKKKLLLGAAGAAAAGGATLDVDNVFSTFVYDGTGSTQNINNGINLGNNIAGSVDFDGAGDSLESSSHSFAYGTGDFTVEFWVYFDGVSGTKNIFDNRSSGSTGFMIGINSSSIMRFYWNGVDRIADTATVSTGQWYHIAVARSSNTIKMFKNGTQIGSDYTSPPDFTSSVLEIGQRSTSDGLEFDGKLSNVRVVLGTAVYTSNFTTPTEPLTAISGTELLICTSNNLEDEGPNKITFTVKGNPQVLSSSPFTGNTGEGGLVWIKNRDDGENHGLVDTAVNGLLFSNLTNAANTGITHTFNSNGFTVGSAGSMNDSNDSHVSWTFRNSPMFQCLTYTGNGPTGSSSDTPQTISHNLGSVPGLIIVKKTSGTSQWLTFHRSIGSSKYLKLNATSAQTDSTDGGAWATYDPTSTDFKVGFQINDNGATYVAYLFAHHANDGSSTGFGSDGASPVISCGSYTEVNGADVKVDLGFEPQWIMIKVSDTTGGWGIYDVQRGWNSGSDDFSLSANTSSAEANVGDRWLIHPDGFTWKNTGNTRGIIYMAIRRGPLAAPTDATKVFAIDTDIGTSTGTNEPYAGFVTDLVVAGNRTSGGKRAFSRLTGLQYMWTYDSAAESTIPSGELGWDSMTGWTHQQLHGSPNVWWQWARAPSYFDCVAYSGTQVARTIPHNIGLHGAVPEMMWVKNRSSGTPWMVYHSGMGNQAYLQLNSTAAAVTGNTSRWNATTPTASVFSLGDSGSVNALGSNFIAYLFSTLDGISKCGSYFGTSSSQNIDCGFSNSARFVLVKRYDGTDSWYVADSVRGISSGQTDKILKLNTTDAEFTESDNSADYIAPHSSGFNLPANSPLNGSGDNFIFYAIA